MTCTEISSGPNDDRALVVLTASSATEPKEEELVPSGLLRLLLVFGKAMVVRTVARMSSRNSRLCDISAAWIPVNALPCAPKVFVSS